MLSDTLSTMIRETLAANQEASKALIRMAASLEALASASAPQQGVPATIVPAPSPRKGKAVKVAPAPVPVAPAAGGWPATAKVGQVFVYARVGGKYKGTAGKPFAYTVTAVDKSGKPVAWTKQAA